MPREPARAPAAAGPQVLALGLAQVLAWGSSTYLPAVVAGPVCASLGVTRGTFFAAFSVALIVMAVAGPAIGRTIDREGGRRALCASNAVLALGLLGLSMAQGVVGLFAAWAVIGLGMALGLYDAAFAALVRQHGPAARRLIVGVSLVGGFASTVGWPLSAWISDAWGWRVCCQVWAAVHLCVGLPIHLRFLRRERAAPVPAAPASPAPVDASASPAVPASSSAAADTRRRSADMTCLYAFSGCTAFVTSAMAVHLPGLLLATGSTLAQALLAGALLGPAQVAARLAEYGLAQRARVHPLSTARLATALHPAACLVLAASGAMPLAAALFAVLHGAGNGMVSVARGVLPLAIFGAHGYGAVTGKLAFFGRSMQAAAPFAFALVLDRFGARPAMTLSAGMSLIALGALLRLRR